MQECQRILAGAPKAAAQPADHRRRVECGRPPRTDEPTLARCV